MFSPYYAAARRSQGGGDPLDHVSINAILYTPRGKHWAMTERGRTAIEREPSRISIGPSAWRWRDGRLCVDVDEWTVPIPRRLRGTITVDPGPIFDRCYSLHENGRHEWRPVAPLASVEVRFEQPALGWRGTGYLDMNAGSEPLEAGFRHWNWSRGDCDGATRIHYDVAQRDGARRGLALEYRADGAMEAFAPAPLDPLRSTGWRVSRAAHGDGERPARILRTLEDTPFYSRSMLGFREEEGCTAIHESVDLDRFRSRWVQVLLPFKMPRRAG